MQVSYNIHMTEPQMVFPQVFREQFLKRGST